MKIIILLMLIPVMLTAADNVLDSAYGLWGIGVVSRDLNYHGTATELNVSPFIFGGFGPFFIEANRIGYSFYRDGRWFASVAGLYRSHQYRPGSSPFGRRRSSVEAGLHLGHKLPAGFVLRLAIMHDVSVAHKSFELDGQLFRHDQLGPVRLLSAAGLQFQSSRLVQYYYGTSNYKPDGAFVGELEFIATLPVHNWGFFIGTRIFIYDRQVSASPVADGSSIAQYFAGLGYYL